MAANKFEKNVQKTLDEFKLHPSEAVWQSVEKRIRKKSRRRIIFFIIFSFLGLMLAGYGVYHFSNRQKFTSEVRSRKLDKNRQGARNNEQDTTRIDNIQTRNLTVKTNSIKEIAISKEPVSKKTQYDEEEVKKLAHRNNALLFLKRKNLMMVNVSQEDEQKQKINALADTMNQIIIPDISFNNRKQNFSDTADQKITPTQVSKDIEKNIPSDTFSLKNEENKTYLTLAPVKKREKHNSASEKLKWGLNLSVGSSTITQRRFSFKSGQNSDISSSPPGSSTGGGGTGLLQPQSANESSFAFKAGLVMKKNLSKRSSLTISLDYNYLADKIKIGARQNGSPQMNSSYDVSAYYSGTPRETFKDRFHFIELPLSYGWRMTNNAKHFISLDVGASIAYLIATNALVYDTVSSGIYYHSKDLFDKAHINLISGFSYHFTGKKNLELSIGPQFSFDMKKIFKTDLDKRKYLLYTGMGVTIFFEKQKKN